MTLDLPHLAATQTTGDARPRVHIAGDAIWFCSRLSRHISRDNCAMVAGAMSFFCLISVFPLAILAISVFGRALGSSKVAEDEVNHLLEMLVPGTAPSLMVQIRYIAHHTHHEVTEVLSLLALLWSGSHIFDYLERALNHTWGVAQPRGFVKRKITAVMGFFTAGVLFLLSLASTAMFAGLSGLSVDGHGFSLHELTWVFPGLSLFSAWTMALLMFFLIYWLLPNTRVPTPLALYCALLATVLWELSKVGFSDFISRTDTYGWIYGPLAGTILTMAWVYLSSMIMLLGAEVGRTCMELTEERKERGTDTTPEPQFLPERTSTTE